MLNLSDFAAEAVCLALDVAIIGVLSKAYYSAKNSIQFIQVRNSE